MSGTGGTRFFTSLSERGLAMLSREYRAIAVMVLALAVWSASQKKPQTRGQAVRAFLRKMPWSLVQVLPWVLTLVGWLWTISVIRGLCG